MIFADAFDGFDEAKFVIVGIPYEDKEMSFRRGAAQAPDYIREVSDNYESYDIFTGIDLGSIPIHDAGNMGLEEAKNFIEKVVSSGKVAISMGGAHSITPFIIPSGIDGVVILDAHADFRNEYLNNRNSHACAARRIFEKMGRDRVISIGVRSISKEEAMEAERLGYRYYTSRQFTPYMADEITYEKIYLSIDMDVFDPCYATGVSNPEPMGLGYEVFEFIKKIADRVMAMDVVEVCPPYDDGRAGLLAAKLIRDFIAWKF